MNEQEEILVRQSKWSGRRVVLLYWFALVFVGTAAAAGLGVSILDPKYKFEAAEADPHASITDPWHAEDCVACHGEIVDSWNDTWHSKMVQLYDPTDPTLNGSKMSYNGTHYWRTPNTMANETDPTNMSNIEYWTYNQMFNASGQQCCMTTRWVNTTLINATTGEVLWTNATLVAQYGGNIWDVGVSCAACHTNPGEKSLSYSVCRGCHTPGGAQWMGYVQSEHYNSLDDLLASGGISSLTGNMHYKYVGQSTYMNVADMNASDYYTITCATCHDPHNASININDVSNAFSPYTNPYTNQTFGPGGSQLRAATVNDLCGQCHDISLNTSTNYFLDPSNHTSLSCTDCHGYEWKEGGMTMGRSGPVYTPPGFSALQHNWVSPDDPDDCALCHGNNNATVWATMQTYLANFGNVTAAKETYTTKLAAAEAKWAEANATVGVDKVKLTNAYNLIQEAKDLAKDNPVIYHNPELGVATELEQLALAAAKLDDALAEATAAIDSAVNPTITQEVTVKETVEATATSILTETTTTSAPAIGIFAVIGILGVVAIFLRKRR